MSHISAPRALFEPDTVSAAVGILGVHDAIRTDVNPLQGPLAAAPP
jgi:hypothetical protein